MLDLLTAFVIRSSGTDPESDAPTTGLGVNLEVDVSATQPARRQAPLPQSDFEVAPLTLMWHNVTAGSSDAVGGRALEVEAYFDVIDYHSPRTAPVLDPFEQHMSRYQSLVDASMWRSLTVSEQADLMRLERLITQALASHDDAVLQKVKGR
jgi:hypothetical protein